MGVKWSGLRQVDPFSSSLLPLTIQGRVAAVGSVRIDNRDKGKGSSTDYSSFKYRTVECPLAIVRVPFAFSYLIPSHNSSSARILEREVTTNRRHHISRWRERMMTYKVGSMNHAEVEDPSLLEQ